MCKVQKNVQKYRAGKMNVFTPRDDLDLPLIFFFVRKILLLIPQSLKVVWESVIIFDWCESVFNSYSGCEKQRIYFFFYNLCN